MWNCGGVVTFNLPRTEVPHLGQNCILISAAPSDKQGGSNHKMRKGFASKIIRAKHSFAALYNQLFLINTRGP
jgi:hypothetical protein